VVGGQVGMVRRRLHRLLVGMAGVRRRGVTEEGLRSIIRSIGIVGLDEVMVTLIL
jgi:hypothetical protein